MPDDNRYNDDDKNSKRGSEFRVPPRTWIVWIAIFGGIILLMLFKDRMDSLGELISKAAFQELVDSNQIVQATITYSPQSQLNEISGKYWKLDNDRRVEKAFRARVRLTASIEERLIKDGRLVAREPNTM